MHHEDIKAMLRKKGVKPAELARHLGVSGQAVGAVLRGSKSARIASAIARVVELPIETLWPGDTDRSRASSHVARLLSQIPTAAARRSA